ncbi:hypothetical protein TKK_0008941 [Trichogramma kaykai]
MSSSSDESGVEIVPEEIREAAKNISFNLLPEISRRNSNCLWSIYSMLRATFSTFNQVDISSYNKLKYYIKRKCDGHKPKKSATFTKEQLQRFFIEAPDDIYLSTKVVAIFGIFGAL